MTMSVISTPQNLYDRHRPSYPDISDTCEWCQDSKEQSKNTITLNPDTIHKCRICRDMTFYDGHRGFRGYL